MPAASYLAPAPKQLDIVADTMLAKNGNPTELSTASKTKTPTELSTAIEFKTPTELLTALKRLDARRRKLNITVEDLLTAASVNRDTYFDARAGRSTVRPSTLAKLTAALDRLSAGAEAQEPRTLCLALLRLVTAEFSKRAGWDPQLMLSQSFAEERPQDPVWLQASRMRRCAVYVLVEGLFISKAAIGKAIGHSRQAVHKTVAAIEMERDRDPAFDKLMQTMMDTVKE